MLRISHNQIKDTGAGCFAVTGSATRSGLVFEWWFSDTPATKKRDGFQTSGTSWRFDWRLCSPSDSITIHALDGLVPSNVLTFNFSTGQGITEPSALGNEFSNEFDAFLEDACVSMIDADKAIIVRQPLESNASVRDRALDAFINRGSGDYAGICRGIERELCLPHISNIFGLCVRFNPLSGKPHQAVRVSIGRHSAFVQAESFMKHTETIVIDGATGIFNTAYEIGGEGLTPDSIIEVMADGRTLDSSDVKVIGTNEMQIDMKASGVTAASKLSVSYPYAKSISYWDSSGNALSVEDLRDFFTQAASVTDENGATVPLLVFHDGAFVQDDSVDPVTATEVKSLEQAMSTTYPTIKILTGVSPVYMRYTSKYADLELFPANRLIPAKWIELTHIPHYLDASWVSMNSLSDDAYIERMSGSTGNLSGNIIRYAERIIDDVHVGISRTMVDSDYWNSDSPQNIGSHVVPSRYDSLPNSMRIKINGSYQDITLAQRRHYARMLASRALA